MKIKYKYRVHQLTDVYPTEEDAIFDICSFLSERDKLEEEWSNLGIKPAFHAKIKPEEISGLLSDLVKAGFLSERIGSGKRNYYKVIDHPFKEQFSNHTKK